MRRALAVLALPALLGAETVPLPKGVLIPSVACEARPASTYALYLPSAYTPDRPWPVVVGFSPDGRGTDVVQRFQAAAEALGFIVAGSNESRNGPLKPALQAQESLWKDLNARFKLDPKRAYAAGLSGGARMALRLARANAGRFAGVVSFGAFFVDEEQTLSGLRGLDCFLVAGQEDFNHFELVRARELLHGSRLASWSETVPGGHGWPTAEAGTEALTFLQIMAARRGWIPEDKALAAGFVADRIAAAEAAEAAGEGLQALRLWEDLARTFPGTEAAQRAAKEAPRLKAAAGVKAELALEARGAEAQRKLQEERGTPAWGRRVTELAGLLRTGGPQERRMALRALGVERVLVAEAAQAAFDKSDWGQAASLFAMLPRMGSRNPGAWILAGEAYARSGEADAALTCLRAGVAAGWKDADELKLSPHLESLRAKPEFQALLKSLATPPPGT